MKIVLQCKVDVNKKQEGEKLIGSTYEECDIHRKRCEEMH